MYALHYNAKSKVASHKLELESESKSVESS